MTVSERVKYLRDLFDEHGITIVKVVKIHPSSFSSVITGNNKPGYNFIEKLLRNTVHPKTGEKLNPDWFFGLSDDMWKSEERQLTETGDAYYKVLEDTMIRNKEMRELIDLLEVKVRELGSDMGLDEEE